MTFLRLPFEAVFADESGGNVKTPQGEYLSAGAFPVVDQGKALIGGYVDDESRLCGGGRPAIVFGDHTRCIKYVDFPFCMGADGVKVLRPKVEADLRYLYYYLQTVKLPDAGYDRHFKYLKRTEVVLPPLPEQRRIAAILDQADSLRAKRREALAQLDSLTQSIFIEMFGDPVANTKGWPQSKLQTIASLINGRAFKPDEWEDDGLPIIRIQNLNDDTKPFNYTTQVLPEKFKVRPNEILFSWSGTPGTSFGCFRWRGGEGWLNQHIFKVLLDEKRLDGDFFIQQMNLKLSELISQAHGGVGLQHVTKGMIDETLLLLPPLALQKEFSNRLQAVNTLEKSEKGSLGELESLFASLQHRAFRGEL